jgi:tRNA pseudouridine32 synthase/23S rRNA pseudouridine746 synthase
MPFHDLQTRVLYRDDLIIVLDKPQGIPVHPGPRGGPSLEDYFGDLTFDYHHPPHLAHRLDRDTGGCLILGRNRKALQKLGRLFETKRIGKTYWALVHGGPKEDSGVVDGWLEKVKTPKGWYMKTSGENANAQTAVTDWKVLKRGEKTSWLELSPRTGRTHQIRVHCLHLGCPIIGDWVYGPPAAEGETLPLLHLHARSVEIPLYEGKPPLHITAEAPDYFSTFN